MSVLLGPQPNYFVPKESIGKYLFERLKKRNPRHIIMVDMATGKTLQTGELLEESLAATKVLQECGVKKGDVIAIVSENTLTYCIPQLAAFYMGVTVQLLNPVYSTGELKHALAISKPKLILCSQLPIKNVAQALEELQFKDVKILLLEGILERQHDITSFEHLLRKKDSIDPKSFKPATFDYSELGALILMSSGTTGLPKGVLLTHRNIRATFAYLFDEEYIGSTESDVTVFVLPFFHIFGILLQIMAIAVGTRLVLLRQFKPDIFLECVQQQRPKTLFVVPPLLLFLAKSPLVDKYDISSVKDIIVGGAPIGEQLYTDAMERLPNLAIRQVYGATESCGGITITKQNDVVIGSAGVLVPHIKAKVLDSETKKPITPSKVGELCFKGPMIMKDYVGNVRETCIDEEGFLHSGDLGFFDENGHIHIVDRLKELIKYKGFQVPPAELEALILTHPAVQDCSVIGIPDERAGQVPLAYVVKQSDSDVTQQDIVDYVAERISVQKRLYGGVRFIDEIPKTASGKILRRKLTQLFNKTL